MTRASFVQRGVAKAQGIGDDGDGTEAHGCAGEHGAQKDAEEWIEGAGCDGDTHKIIDEREEKVLADVAERGVAEANGPGDAPEIPLEKRDARALDGDVRAGAHGDAYVRFAEGGGIVDAIASHGDAAARCPELADMSGFSLGGHPGFHGS